MRSLSMIVVALALCACASTGGNGVGARAEPPAGFVWREIAEINAVFQMPAGWHYMEAEKGNTFGFFLTKESIEDGAKYETGLSVNVIRGDVSTDAVDNARQFVERMVELNEVLDSWEIEDGKFRGFGCRTRNPAPLDDSMYIMHTLAMGNPATNTVYYMYMWFESREETWPEAWVLGEKMLDQFVLDDAI